MVKTLIAVVIALQVLDLLSFMWVMNYYEIAAEANPIAQAVYRTGGMTGLVGYKLAGIAVFLFLIKSVIPHKRMFLGISIFSITVGFLGYTTNVMSVGAAL